MTTTTREDLADVIGAVTDNWDEPLDSVHDIPQIVNAILAAGYRKPRVIESAAELDALPVGSILLDGGRTPIRKEADGFWYWGEMPLTPGLILPCNPNGLTVLHEGAA